MPLYREDQLLAYLRPTDAWFTRWLQDAHFYPAGSTVALCGARWDSKAWRTTGKGMLVCNRCRIDEYKRREI